jgi:endoglucanase
MLICKVILGLLLGGVTEASPHSTSKRGAPTLPLSTKGRDILDANGNVFHYASTNWPGGFLVTDCEEDHR